MIMRYRHLLTRFTLFLALCCLLAGAAQAADTTPPVITHTAVTSAPSDTDLIIAARIADESALERTTLYFRMQGSTNYYSTGLVLMAGEYRATIPATYVTPGGIEYYIQAVDLTGNVAVWPVGGAAAPQRISVEKDMSPPEPEVLLTTGAPGQPVDVVVYVHDEAGNVDPGMVRVLWNGKDVTDLVEITDGFVTFTVTPEEGDVSSRLTVEAVDRAGNRASRTFTVWRDPYWQRELRVDLETGQRPHAVLSVAVDWGPFSASAKVDSWDPMFTSEPGQPKNQFRLTYDTRPITVALGDVRSSYGPLSLSSLYHRGVDLTLRGGPFSLNTLYGVPKQYVAGKDYRREAFGLRGAFNSSILGLEAGLVKLQDKWSAADDIGLVDPEVNYVLDAELSSYPFGNVSFTSAAALSIYHNNARGSLWQTFDNMKANKGIYSDEIQAVIEMADKIPAGVRNSFALPDILLYGLPKIDTGVQATLSVPVGLAYLNLKGYRFGRDYQTIAGSEQGNALGFRTELAQIRLGNSIRGNVHYERKTDNVKSLLDMALDLTPNSPNAYQNYGMRFSIGQWGRPMVDVGLTSETKGPVGGTVAEKSTAYQLGLRGYQINLEEGVLRLGISADRLSYRDLRQADGSLDKDTTTVKGTANYDRANWSADLGAGIRREVDGHGVNVLTGPLLDASYTWINRQVRVLGLHYDEVRFRAAAAYDRANDQAGVQVSGKRDLSLTLTGRMNPNLEMQAGWRQIAEFNQPVDDRLLASLRWNF
jgi:hypothetical protein